MGHLRSLRYIGRDSARASLRMKAILIIVALSLASISFDACAFFDQPYITPTNPSVGDTIVMNVYGGGCDAIIGTPGYPQITQQGNNIHMLLYGAHYDPNPDLCIYGNGTASETVGSFPAGSYTLEVDMQYISIFGATEFLTIGTVDFTVSGAGSVRSAPSLTWVGATALIACLIVIVGLWRRKSA